MRMAVADAEVGLLHRVSNIVSSELSVDEILGEVLGLAAQATACDACLIYLFDHNSNEMVLHASQVPHAADLGKLRIKVGEGVTGWVAEHKSAVALGERRLRRSAVQAFPDADRGTYEAFLSVPLVSAGDLIGVINVHHRLPHDHTREEIAVMKFIGEQLGVTISKSLLERENARLMEETAEMKRELETRKIVERAKGICSRSTASARRMPISGCAIRAAVCAVPCGRWPRRSSSPRIWIAKLRRWARRTRRVAGKPILAAA